MLVFGSKEDEAVKAVERAMEFAKELQVRLKAQLATLGSAKGDKTMVTPVDYAVQAMLGIELWGHLLSEDLPFCGEEQADQLKQNQALLQQVHGYFAEHYPSIGERAMLEFIGNHIPDTSVDHFITDPVDGTLGFLEDGSFAVMLSFYSQDKIVFTAIGCPYLQRDGTISPDGPGTVFFADQTGAYVKVPSRGAKWRKLDATKGSDRIGLTILHSRALENSDRGQFDRVVSQLREMVGVVCVDSALKFCMLAMGMADAYIRFAPPAREDLRVFRWDMAAGVFLVRAAGGRVTDLNGHDFEVTQAGGTLTEGLVTINGFVATGQPAIHEQLLTAVASQIQSTRLP